MKCAHTRCDCDALACGACNGDFDPSVDVCAHFRPKSEHGADARVSRVSGPSPGSPPSAAAGQGAVTAGQPRCSPPPQAAVNKVLSK
jgi:hypothetical protein